MSKAVHLAKRFVLSLVPSQVEEIERQWVHSVLSLDEFDLWNKMMVQDRRHSVLVGRRFVKYRPTASHVEIAGALLHDVGKSASRLGTLARVFATLVGLARSACANITITKTLVQKCFDPSVVMRQPSLWLKDHALVD